MAGGFPRWIPPCSFGCTEKGEPLATGRGSPTSCPIPGPYGTLGRNLLQVLGVDESCYRDDDEKEEEEEQEEEAECEVTDVLT